MDLIKQWQELIGTCIGAATPIFFWFFIEWKKHAKEHQQNLSFLRNELVFHLNKVSDAELTIQKFIDEKLSKLITSLERSTPYYIDGLAFVPLFSMEPMEKKILERSLHSGYLENKVLQSLSMSKDFYFSIEDIRQQFDQALQKNKEMCYQKLNPPEIQNKQFKENLESFKEMLEKDILKQNINTYIKLLIQTFFTVKSLQRLGLRRWRWIFSSSFRYFKDTDTLKRYTDSKLERIDEYIEKGILLEKGDIAEAYKEATKNLGFSLIN